MATARLGLFILLAVVGIAHTVAWVVALRRAPEAARARALSSHALAVARYATR